MVLLSWLSSIPPTSSGAEKIILLGFTGASCFYTNRCRDLEEREGGRDEEERQTDRQTDRDFYLRKNGTEIKREREEGRENNFFDRHKERNREREIGRERERERERFRGTEEERRVRMRNREKQRETERGRNRERERNRERNREIGIERERYRGTEEQRNRGE